jgi:hypothetical protein
MPQPRDTRSLEVFKQIQGVIRWVAFTVGADDECGMAQIFQGCWPQFSQRPDFHRQTCLFSLGSQRPRDVFAVSGLRSKIDLQSLVGSRGGKRVRCGDFCQGQGPDSDISYERKRHCRTRQPPGNKSTQPGSVKFIQPSQILLQAVNLSLREW